MMMRLMFAALLLLGAGCHGTDRKTPQDLGADVPAPVAAPPARENGMNLESQVATARADLGERLGLPESEIEVLEARHVTWADSSLGCPQPGMAYMQVLTPGVLVRLGAEGREYRYHGSTRGQPSLCLNPEGEPMPGLEDR
jgi:hypothetical protein